MYCHWKQSGVDSRERFQEWKGKVGGTSLKPIEYWKALIGWTGRGCFQKWEREERLNNGADTMGEWSNTHPMLYGLKFLNLLSLQWWIFLFALVVPLRSTISPHTTFPRHCVFISCLTLLLMAKFVIARLSDIEKMWLSGFWTVKLHRSSSRKLTGISTSPAPKGNGKQDTNSRRRVAITKLHHGGSAGDNSGTFDACVKFSRIQDGKVFQFVPLQRLRIKILPYWGWFYSSRCHLSVRL